MGNPVGTTGTGDLSHFKQSKIPTLPSHKNVCQEKHCIAWTFPLSYHDKPHGTLNGFPVYEHTTKWKCEDGHRIDTTSLVDMDENKLRKN
jgi:hypothetical protein